MRYRSSLRPSILLTSLLSASLLAACGVKEKLEQRVNEEIAEKVVEVAAGGEIDVEAHDGKVTVVGKDGQTVTVDGEQGTARVIDEHGKVYDYVGDQQGATVKGSDGLDAQMGTQIPADFPIDLPKAKTVQLGHRVVQPDGSKSFTVNYEAEAGAGELEAVVEEIQRGFEAKGLVVTRSEFTGPQGKMVTLAGKQDGGKLEASAMISTTQDNPGVTVVVGWQDKTGVGP